GDSASLHGGESGALMASNLPSMKKPDPSRLQRSAFTLLELCIVAALLAVLLLLSLPIAGKVRATSQATKCLANLRNYGNAIVLYATDNDGLPWWNGQAYPASAQN